MIFPKARWIGSRFDPYNRHDSNSMELLKVRYDHSNKNSLNFEVTFGQLRRMLPHSPRLTLEWVRTSQNFLFSALKKFFFWGGGKGLVSVFYTSQCDQIRCKIVKVLKFFEGLFNIRQNFNPTLANFVCSWANFQWS